MFICGYLWTICKMPGETRSKNSFIPRSSRSALLPGVRRYVFCEHMLCSEAVRLDWSWASCEHLRPQLGSKHPPAGHDPPFKSSFRSASQKRASAPGALGKTLPARKPPTSHLMAAFSPKAHDPSGLIYTQPVEHVVGLLHPLETLSS